MVAEMPSAKLRVLPVIKVGLSVGFYSYSSWRGLHRL